MAACLMNTEVLQSSYIYFSENQEVIIQVLYYVMIQLPPYTFHYVEIRHSVFFFGKSSFSVIQIYPPNFLQCTKFNFLSERVVSNNFHRGKLQRHEAATEYFSGLCILDFHFCLKPHFIIKTE